MPELPEVEITARLIGDAIAGSRVDSALSPGINALKTFDPPLSALTGRRIRRVGRRGKLLLAEFEDDLVLCVHNLARSAQARREAEAELAS